MTEVDFVIVSAAIHALSFSVDEPLGPKVYSVGTGDYYTQAAQALSRIRAENERLSDLVHAQAQQIEARWQPIETAPKDGTIIDVWLGDADGEECEFYCSPGTKRSASWQWRQGRFRPFMGLGMPVVTVRPTHWMPLPQQCWASQPIADLPHTENSK